MKPELKVLKDSKVKKVIRATWVTLAPKDLKVILDRLVLKASKVMMV